MFDSTASSMFSSLSRGQRLWLWRILAVFLIYGAMFIYRTSFVIDVGGGQVEDVRIGEASEPNAVRTFVLFDDAMISMRYARNLASGHGLVWNPGGARVEGFTNPAWVLILAGVHKFTPLSPFKISLVVQAVALAILAACVMLTFVLTNSTFGRHRGSLPIALVAMGFTAFYYPLNFWSLTGMEVSLCVLIILSAMFLVLRERPVAGLMLLGAATWLRLDMAVIFLAVWGYSLVFGGGRRMALLIGGSLIFGTALGSQTALRMWYYGDPLPNTYYLKMTGFPVGLRILRGTVHAVFFLARSSWPLLALGAVVGMCMFRNKNDVPNIKLRALLSPCPTPSKFVILAGVCFCVQVAYSAYVGGDAWERVIACNRFISVVIPLFFILYAAAVYALSGKVNHRYQKVVFVAVCAVSLLNFNSFPRANALAQWVLAEAPPYSEINRDNVRLALAVQEVTTLDAVVAVDYAGMVPYFADRTFLDLLGKCDRVVSRGPMHRHVMTSNPLLEFYPGHLKWDYAYSIGELRPDMVLARWGKDKADALTYLQPDYRELNLAGLEAWVLKDSPHILLH